MMVLLASCALCCACGGFVYCTVQLLLGHVDAARVSLRPLTIDDVLGDRMLGFAAFGGVGVVLAWTLGLETLPACLALAVALAYFAPGYMARRRERALRAACEDELGCLADTLAFSMRAGMGFDAAVLLYCSKFDGALSRLLAEAHTQWSSGLATRRQALEDMNARIGSQSLARFSNIVVQAVEFGSPLAGMLEQFAEDLRRAARAQIERKVEKAPVKMLLPMGVCILPAMLALVLGPVILQFQNAGF